MISVFIGSPYASCDADEHKRHIEYARGLCRVAATHGFAPLAPHLFVPQFLCDGDARERSIGLGAGRELLERMDIAIFGIDLGTSGGMKSEIAHCVRRSIPYACVESQFFLSELIKLGEAWKAGNSTIKKLPLV